jgi:hypothetical protein
MAATAGLALRAWSHSGGDNIFRSAEQVAYAATHAQLTRRIIWSSYSEAPCSARVPALEGNCEGRIRLRSRSRKGWPGIRALSLAGLTRPALGRVVPMHDRQIGDPGRA